MITVVVPVHNEQDNIKPLLEEIAAAADKSPIKEIVYVDDGSTDETQARLQEMKKTIPMLRVVRHKICAGQSAAFMTGVRAATQNLIVLMDGDGQNNPADISKIYDTFRSEFLALGNKEDTAEFTTATKAMVAGQREKRNDNTVRRISSRLANKIRSAILRDKIRDTGCSLKLIRREDYLRLPYFNHMHRYFPALLIRDHIKILTVDVSHRPRERGTSKYGFWDRLWVGIVDLVGVRWLLFRGLPSDFETEEIS